MTVYFNADSVAALFILALPYGGVLPQPGFGDPDDAIPFLIALAAGALAIGILAGIAAAGFSHLLGNGAWVIPAFLLGIVISILSMVGIIAEANFFFSPLGILAALASATAGAGAVSAAAVWCLRRVVRESARAIRDRQEMRERARRR